jgi:hypothetical protein
LTTRRAYLRLLPNSICVILRPGNAEGTADVPEFIATRSIMGIIPVELVLDLRCQGSPMAGKTDAASWDGFHIASAVISSPFKKL